MNLFGKNESFDFIIDADNEALRLIWTVDYQTDPWGFPAPNISWVQFENLGSHHFNFTTFT